MKVERYKRGDVVKSKCCQIGIIDEFTTDNYSKDYKGCYFKITKYNKEVPVYSMLPLTGNKVAWFKHEELKLIRKDILSYILKYF